MNIEIEDYEYIAEKDVHQFDIFIRFSNESFLSGINLIRLNLNGDILNSEFIFNDDECSNSFTHLLQAIDWYCLGWFRGKDAGCDLIC